MLDCEEELILSLFGVVFQGYVVLSSKSKDPRCALL